ncbi:MAG TPA: type I-E CRISPR-associated protein Cas6/Cse3/CasE [Mycobacteriales bacterium]|nr:type I-E CRISPR-associated protein Cas6/Cse3/CasE [Mycobacteriales bacterium]
MPYLSRIWINPLRRNAQRMLGNPQVLHAAILGGIARQPVTERVLWRLERDTPHRAGVLVLTDSSPSWEHLVEQAGWPNADEPQALVRRYEPLLDKIQRGREFAFRLRANPTSATRHPDKPSAAQQQRLADSPRARGVRVAHRTAQYQLDWLAKGVPKWGFELPSTMDGSGDVLLTGRERMTFVKGDGDADRRRRVVIQTATFEGRLRVTDPDLARHSLLNGVGTARAYGCGLITLAPLHPTAG